jgi:RimJ/RimL family protein N-acetyltransferase
MQLKPPNSREDLELIASWLGQKENNQWLDLGDGRQLVSPEWLKMAMQRGSYLIRLFTSDEHDRPVGIVALSNINTKFKSATLWVVLGDKTCARRGYATRAVSKILTLGFTELGLTSINTWVVEHNHSVGVCLANGFRPIGRQRQCHYIDGRAYDRLWFDILASEHEEIGDGRRERAA